MSYSISQESFDTLIPYWENSNHHLRWSSIFTTPPWLKVWWQELGPATEPYLNVISQEGEVIGIVALQLAGDTAAIIGSPDVCDYLDFVVVPEREDDFFRALLSDLREKGINHLNLRALRSDSTVLTHLTNVARERGYQVDCEPDDVSLELTLPATWDEYLTMLSKKQRHEVRRKLRRLTEAGEVNYHTVQDSATINREMDRFFDMFVRERADKAGFLTSRMRSFFRSLADTTARLGLLQFGMLELNGVTTAMVMCFDYGDGIYLYNSSYNLEYRHLSVGLLSKVLCIQGSIEQGKKRFDFLKGNEAYKHQLGGREFPLQRCQITMS
jgi:CelD/BcsL family acetyltransferase involved in cellulose biosynthesis